MKDSQDKKKKDGENEENADWSLAKVISPSQPIENNN